MYSPPGNLRVRVQGDRCRPGTGHPCRPGLGVRHHPRSRLGTEAPDMDQPTGPAGVPRPPIRRAPRHDQAARLLGCDLPIRAPTVLPPAPSIRHPSSAWPATGRRAAEPLRTPRAASKRARRRVPAFHGAARTLGGSCSPSARSGSGWSVTAWRWGFTSRSVRAGNVVAVYEHHRIPVDGTTESGEALPVYVQPGSDVCAGTLISNGSLTMRAASVGQDTVLGWIITRVEEAQADRAPPQTVTTPSPAVSSPSPSPCGDHVHPHSRRPTGDHHAAHRLPLRRGPCHPDRGQRPHRRRRPLSPRCSARSWHP